MKIEVGQIWEVVTDNFLTGKDKKTLDRQLKLDKGEKIEIRFPFAWNFRTIDDKYLHSSEQMILDNCHFFGQVTPEIRSQNIANLEEIIRLKLFKK